MPDYTVADMMQAYSQNAVDLAQEGFKVTLDYSEQSLERVEEILAIYHKQVPKGFLQNLFKKGPSDEDIWAASKIWGGYVGEVIRRRWSGEWTDETGLHPGKVIITLRVRWVELYPADKVYKRLKNGAEDNVWHYYKALCDILQSNLQERLEDG